MKLTKIAVHAGRTISAGDYEFVKPGITLELDASDVTDANELEQKLAALQKLAERHLDKIAKRSLAAHAAAKLGM
jgi:hypothetical protein